MSMSIIMVTTTTCQPSIPKQMRKTLLPTAPCTKQKQTKRRGISTVVFRLSNLLIDIYFNLFFKINQFHNNIQSLTPLSLTSKK